VVLGLVFLTRAEFFVAAAPSITIGACAALYARRAPARTIRRHLPGFVASTLLAPLVAMLLLHRALPWNDALNAMLGSWRWSFDSRVVGMSFYENLVGTDWPTRNLGRTLFCAAGYLLLLGGSTIAAMLIRRPGEGRLIAAAVAAGLVIATMFILVNLATDLLYKVVDPRVVLK